MQSAFNAIGAVALGGLGTLAAGLGKSVSMFVDFDDEMRKAGAIAGASAEEFDKMKAAAIDLGGKTSKSASEIATAYTELAAKGFTANEVMAAMPGIVAAAEASGEDLALTADTIASALNIWSLEAGESARVADVLAMSANISAAGIDDLGYVLKYAGAPASALGISLEEVAAAAGIMTNAGLDGSNAGTALRASLLALNNPAKAQAEIMKELGFSILDSEGNAKGLSQMIGDLGKALEGETEAQKVATLGKLVGTEAVSGFLSLMNAGPSEIDKMSESLRNSGGASQEAADKMKAGIGGALEQLSGSIESVALSIGGVLAPDLQKLATSLSEIDTTALTEGFRNFYEYGKNSITMIGELIEKFTPLLYGILAGAAAFQAITVSMAAYNAILVAYRKVVALATAGSLSFNAILMANPFALVAIAIGLLVAAVVLAYKEVDWFRDMVDKAWKVIKESTAIAFNYVKEIITNVMADVMVFIKDILSKLKAFWSEHGSSIMELIKGVFDMVWKTIKGVMGYIKDIFETVWPIISAAVQVAWGIIKVAVKSGLDIILGLVGTVMDLLEGDWKGAWDSIKGIAEDIWGNIEGFFADVDLVQLGKDIINGLKDGILEAAGSLYRKAEEIAEKIKGIFTGLFKVHSPSRWMRDEIGVNIGKGFIAGLDSIESRMLSTATNLSGNIQDALAYSVPSTSLRAPSSAKLDSAVTRTAEPQAQSLPPIFLTMDNKVVARILEKDISEIQSRNFKVALRKGYSGL